MSYALLGILVLMVIGSFVAAYMSAQTWPIHQVVVMELLFLVSIAFFYLGARTLKTHAYFRQQVERAKKDLAQIEGQLLPLRGGLTPQGQAVDGEIPELEKQLALLTRKRGGVYYNVSADSLEGDVVQLTMRAAPPPAAEPDPNALDEGVEPEPPAEPAADGQPAQPVAHGLAADMIVFAFDAKPVSEGGRYLGEFKVTAAPENSPSVQITPILPMDPEQRKTLEAAIGGTWTLYTSMPNDNAAVFAEMDEAKRQAMLPAASAAEYAQADRPLRDFQLFFHENHVAKSLLRDTIAKTKSNIERTDRATAEAVAEAKFRDAEKAKLLADLKKFQFEVEAIASYQKTLENFLGQVREKLKTTYVENRRAALTLTREQLKAEAEINRRAGAAAAQ